MAASRLITGFGLFVALTVPALANMPPKKYDHPYHGVVAMKQVPVAYTDDKAAFRMCDKLHRQHYGVGYDTSDGFPVYGCTMYDAERKWLRVVYTFDTQAIAKKRLASGASDQRYDQCMAYNSFVHERGHANQAAAGDDINHDGWDAVSRCTYDKRALPVPSS